MVIRLIRYVKLELFLNNNLLSSFSLYSNRKEKFFGNKNFKNILKSSIENPDILKNYILNNYEKNKKDFGIKYSTFHFQIIDGEEQEHILIKEEMTKF